MATKREDKKTPKTKTAKRKTASKKKTTRTSKGGRPSNLTVERKKTLITNIELGLNLEQACKASGVGYSTFREWMRVAEGTHPLRSPKPGSAEHKMYTEFSEEINIAIANSELKLLQKIDKQVSTDWRAGAWILERRFPQRWSNQNRVVQLADEKVASILQNIQWFVSPESYRELVGALNAVGVNKVDSKNTSELQALQVLLESNMLPPEVAPLVGKAYANMRQSMVDAIKGEKES